MTRLNKHYITKKESAAEHHRKLKARATKRRYRAKKKAEAMKDQMPLLYNAPRYFNAEQLISLSGETDRLLKEADTYLKGLNVSPDPKTNQYAFQWSEPKVLADGSKAYTVTAKFNLPTGEVKEVVPEEVKRTKEGSRSEPVIVHSEWSKDVPMTSYIESFTDLGSFHQDSIDVVNAPPHYRAGGTYETIRVIEAWNLNFNLGNAVKYISRIGLKGDKKEQIEKAIRYLKRELALLTQAEDQKKNV